MCQIEVARGQAGGPAAAPTTPQSLGWSHQATLALSHALRDPTPLTTLGRAARGSTWAALATL